MEHLVTGPTHFFGGHRLEETCSQDTKSNNESAHSNTLSADDMEVQRRVNIAAEYVRVNKTLVEDLIQSVNKRIFEIDFLRLTNIVRNYGQQILSVKLSITSKD